MSQIKSTEELIRKAILDFDWHNYGLDEVGEADPEYAGDLAKEITAAIGTYLAGA